jgi:outer membrane protein assembly factor BamB
MSRPFMILGVLLAITNPAAADSSAAAGYWPRFRGPNGTGVSADKNIPIEFSDKSNVRWKTAIPGISHSSPIIWKDRIFMQSGSSDGKERFLLCLNTDGKILWSSKVPGAPAKTHSKTTLASSTPATDGERVYTVFWNGTGLTLHAYNFEGTPVWKYELGKFASQYGAAASPMVHDGKVYYANDQDGSSVLLALDGKTGRVVWEKTRRPHKACYSVPFLLERSGGGLELIATSTAGIGAYNPQTGAEIWNWNFAKPPNRTVASPVHGAGIIFATHGGGSNGGVVAIKAGDKGDVTATNLAWETARGFPYVPGMLTVGEHLYTLNDLGIAGCYEAKTGKRVWTERLRGGVSSSLILIDGKIYAACEDGSVFVYPAEPTFKILARNHLGEGLLATPAVSEGRLYIRGKTHLFCIAKN